MTPDCELLRRYAEQGDEAAFAEVVGRHVDLVYSAALRLVGGDAHLAQDVAQGVFTALARRAARLARHASIAGWLYTTTRYTAGSLRRSQHRRLAREQEAYAMNQPAPSSEINWDALQPVLDEAVCALAAADREAVLLRFFQNKSHREVGDALGLGEDAARKRVDRALEKLRAHFARRGVAVSAGVLAAEIGANSVQAAPVGLAESLTGTSLAGAGAAAEGVFFKIIFMNAKIILLAVSAAVIGLAWGWWRITAPDFPANTALVQTQSKSVATTSQSADLNVPTISNHVTPGKTFEAKNGGTTPIANVNSPTSNLAEMPLPPEVHLTVPLEKAEHQTFTSLGAFYPLDVSIVRYYRIMSGRGQGQEVVQYHIWSGVGRDGTLGGDASKGVSSFSPEEQDLIRNWARQQAAASPAATTPVETLTSLPVKRSIIPSATTPANAPISPPEGNVNVTSNPQN